MSASAPPPPAPPDERSSATLRVGGAVGAGALATFACVVPAAMRVGSSEGPGTLQSWAGLFAAAIGPMVAAVVVLRGAREGLRAFGGPGAGLRAYGVGLWVATMLIGLTIFGSILRATTHHHALAGVTYAFVALGMAVGDALVCARTMGIARRLPERARRVVLIAAAVAVGIILFAVGVRFVRAASHDAASYAAAGTVVDVLAFALAAVFASRPWLARRRFLPVVGPPIALVIAIVGVVALRDQAVYDAVSARAPAFLPVADLLSGH
jgi:hypothetical protein